MPGDVALRGRLSYIQIKEKTGWQDHLMINDYLGIGQGITQLESRVDSNEEGVTENALNLTEHEANTSAHGVTGTNVGSEDFCTDVVGGVVLLMGLVANATDSTAEVVLADVGAAPAAYDQTYADQQTALANDVKAKHNQLLLDLNSAIAQLNELLSNSKTAKQMALL